MLGAWRWLLGPAWVATAGIVVVTWTDVPEVDLWPVADELARGGAAVLLVVSAALAGTRRWSQSAIALFAALGWQSRLLSMSGAPADSVRSASLYASALMLPALGLLVAPRRWRAAWIAVAAIGVTWAAVYDPFHDVRCDTFCGPNVYVVSDAPGTADALLDFRNLFACFVALGVARWGLQHRRWVVASGSAAVAGLAAMAHLDRHRLPGPGPVGSITVVALVALAITPVLLAGQRLLRLVRLRQLAAITASGVGDSLEQGLRAAVGDATLHVAYPSEGGVLVAPDGSEYIRRPEYVETTLTIRDRAVAVVEHSPSIDGSDLQQRFGSTARMAAWNEGLAADLRHQLAEVKASRRRLVDAGDDERRRIERDLHDGAQQGLLALTYDVRLARHRCSGEQAIALDDALEQIHQALTELRELAAGVYPFQSVGVSLDAVLATIAERSMRPAEIDADDVRVPDHVAHTVHDLADSALRAESVEPVNVTARLDRGVLTVCIDRPAAELPQHVTDRIAALGGEWFSNHERWEVMMPCGS